MVKNKHNIYIAIIGLLILVLALRECGYRPKEVIDHYHYNTDTIYSTEPYDKIMEKLMALEKNLKNTPPKEVIYYPVDNPIEVEVEKIPDSLLVYIKKLNTENDSLRIAISDKYIKNYPTASKLIDFKLELDRLEMTTLNIKGDLAKAHYPLYLNSYEYYWIDNELSHREIKRKREKVGSNTWNEFYFNVGYSTIYDGTPFTGLEYQKEFSRIKVAIMTELYLLNNPQLRADIKVGYRLLN